MVISPGDWDTLQKLAGQVGLAAERVGMLRRRTEDSSPRPGSPYVLIAGRRDSGIELLLARWLAPEAAEELQKAGDRPLVIGARPEDVRPRLGVWPTWKSPAFGPGHLIALRAAAKPTADTLAQLSSLGFIDQAILVTRLGQPLHMNEREIAQALASLAATARVLVVGLPGEEPTENDLAEVSAFAISQMRQAGFRDGRCLGAGIWFTGGAKRNGCINDLGAFLAVKAADVAAGRDGMTRSALTVLIDDLRQRAETVTSATAPIADDECDRLVRELASYLADLGRELNHQTKKPVSMNTERLRKYALDALHSWGAYSTVEGFWLKYVERIRPGTQAAFLAEAETALALLEYQAGSGPTGTAAPVEGSPSVDRIVAEAKRLGVGLVLATVSYVLAVTLLGEQGANLKPLLVTLLSYVSLILGMAMGYGAARPFFRLPKPSDHAQTRLFTPPAVHGWLQIERRLTAWFSERIRAKPASPAEECRVLAERLGVKELDR